MKGSLNNIVKIPDGTAAKEGHNIQHFVTKHGSWEITTDKKMKGVDVAQLTNIFKQFDAKDTARSRLRKKLEAKRKAITQ